MGRLRQVVATMIVLHIGMPKTGTSTVQHCLAMHAREHTDGFLYPVAGRGGAVAHHRLANMVSSGSLPDDVVTALRSELSMAAGRVVVISSEGFSNVVPAKLIQFVDGLAPLGPVKLVIAVRELASFLESMYLQSTRFGTFKGTFPTYIATRRKWIGNFIAGL